LIKSIYQKIEKHLGVLKEIYMFLKNGLKDFCLYRIYMMSEVALKIVVCWGLNWWKNASAECGAMNHVIKNKKAGDKVIHSETKKDGRMWASCSAEKVAELIKKNHGIYEVLCDYPYKLCFDIDCKNPVVDKPILEETMQQIKSIWPNGNFAISGSIVENVKESYHIVSDTYVIHNNEERDMVKSAVKYLQSKNDAFDWKIYTPNRNMKCINQSKTDARIQEIIRGDDYRSHLICSFITTYPEAIDCHFDEPLKEKIAIDKASRKINIAALPHLNLETPADLNVLGMKPIDMLKLCPINKDFDHAYTHQIARFSFYNGITFDEFFEWLKPKHNDSANRQRWLSHWNRLDKFPPFKPEQMRRLLMFYYPAFKRDMHMTAFANQFNMPADITITQIQRLEQEHYNPDFKATILHLTMGSGKTAQTIDYLKNAFGGFCWIAHNKALVAGTLDRLAKAQVNCKSYLDFNAKAKMAGALNSVKELCICANSLHYINFDKRYGTLVIDEIESVVDAFMGDFMGENKAKNFAVFKNLILHSTKLILIDAFITMKTINLIRSINPECTINIICQNNVKPTKKITFHSANDESNDEKGSLSNALHNIIEFIKTGKRVFIFYPYKRSGVSHFSMDEVAAAIKSRANCRVVSYNADSDDKVKEGLKDVNKTWADFDCVICNQVITCGVNFDMKGYDKVIMFLASFVKPRQSIQVSARIRNISTNEIDVYYMGRQANQECYIDDRKEMQCPVYSRLYEDFIIEDNAPRRKAFELFCNKAPYKMKRDKYVVDKEISKDMEEYAKTDFEYRFENIDDITASYANNIEELIMQQNCPMYMKFQLKKYYFNLKFEAPPDMQETIREAWNLNLFGIVD
jgi:hypothetical protein